MLSVEVALPLILGREGCRTAVGKERARICRLRPVGLLFSWRCIGTYMMMLCGFFLFNVRMVAMSGRAVGRDGGRSGCGGRGW